MFWQKMGETIGWSALGVVLLFLAVRVYDLLDPINYRQEIRNGNIAAGIIVAAIVAAIAAIIIAVIVT